MNLEKIISTRAAKTIYHAGDNAIKVFDKQYSKADILNEALNQARIEENNLNIPKIKEITSIDGKWAIVLEFIEGKTLAQLMQENKDKYDEYLEMFVNLQIKVHSMESPLLNNLKDKMHRKISETKLNETIRYDLHTRLESMPNHNKICHGDFNPSNIIISESNGEPYIIDWSHATQGNAFADAAITYLCFWLAGDIEGADKYLGLFCRKNNINKQEVQKWLPIAAASQSVKGNLQEKELLLSWVNVVDYE